MIRNIVFDMGMVLMDFHPLLACRAIAPDENSAQQLYTAVFAHPEWVGLDDGTVTVEALAEHAAARLVEPALRPLVSRVLEAMPGNVVSPIPGMAEVVDGVLENGYKVYLLSNAGWVFSRNREMIPRIGRFHGVVFSVEEGLIKPNPALFDRLTSRYALLPEECLLIDDNADNVTGARKQGWQAYRFDGDVAALQVTLAALKRA